MKRWIPIFMVLLISVVTCSVVTAADQSLPTSPSTHDVERGNVLPTYPVGIPLPATVKPAYEDGLRVIQEEPHYPTPTRELPSIWNPLTWYLYWYPEYQIKDVNETGVNVTKGNNVTLAVR